MNDSWLMIRPGPGADGALGPTDNWPTPGKLVISDGGDNANGDDLSEFWQGPWAMAKTAGRGKLRSRIGGSGLTVTPNPPV